MNKLDNSKYMSLLKIVFLCFVTGVFLYWILGQIFLPVENRGEKSTYVVQEDDTMYGISQKMGIKLSKLYRMNNMKQGTEPQAGKILNLQ